jgi:lysozyme
LPPVVDVEQLYGVAPAIMRQRLLECLQILEKKYGTKPIIYSYIDFYEKNLAPFFDEYPLWVAHYEDANKPRTARNWLFWQHSERGHINGITTPVDCNVFNGDSLALNLILLK